MVIRGARNRERARLSASYFFSRKYSPDAGQPVRVFVQTESPPHPTRSCGFKFSARRTHLDSTAKRSFYCRGRRVRRAMLMKNFALFASFAVSFCSRLTPWNRHLSRLSQSYGTLSATVFKRAEVGKGAAGENRARRQAGAAPGGRSDRLSGL